MIGSNLSCLVYIKRVLQQEHVRPFDLNMRDMDDTKPCSEAIQTVGGMIKRVQYGAKLADWTLAMFTLMDTVYS